MMSGQRRTPLADQLLSARLITFVGGRRLKRQEK